MMWRLLKMGLLMFAVLLSGAYSALAKKLKYAIVLGTDNWFHAIDENGRVLADSLFPESLKFYVYRESREGMFPYVRNGKTGFKNYRNEVAVLPSYSLITHSKLREAFYGDDYKLEEDLLLTRFKNGQAVVCSSFGEHFGVIDRHGRLVVDTVYDYIGPAQPNGVRPARRNDTLFLVNKKGRNILSYPYHCDPVITPIPRFGNGLLAVMVRVGNIPYRDFTGLYKNPWGGLEGSGPTPEKVHNYKVGFVNDKGQLMIDTIYEMNVYMLENKEQGYHRFGMARCGNDRPPEKIPADPYSLRTKYYYIFVGERCLVSRGGSRFVIDTRGDSLYSLPYGDEYRNVKGYFIVKAWNEFRPKGTSLIDRDGKEIVPFPKESISEYSDDLFLVEDSPSHYSIVDYVGKKYFKDTYADVRPFFYGYALVNIWLKDQSGREKIVSGRVDSSGHFWPDSVAISPIEEYPKPSVKPFIEGRSAFKDIKTNLWGYLKPDGSIAIPAQYKEIKDFQETEVQD